MNKKKLVEILENIEKNIAKSLNIPLTMEDLFPVADIKNNQVYYEDGSISRIFNVKPIPYDGLTKTEYLEYMNKVTSVLNVLDKNTLLSFIIVSDNLKGDIDNNYLRNKLEDENKNEFINKIIDHRLEANKPKSFLTFKFSVKIININEDSKTFYSPEEFEDIARIKIENVIDILRKYFIVDDLTEGELLLFINSIFNPNNREQEFDGSITENYWTSFDSSLVRTFSRTYANDTGNLIEFNDSYGRVFNLLKPPANPNNLSIFTILEYLDSVSEVNYIMNISMRKAPEALPRIRRKESMAKSQLATILDKTNLKVSENAGEFLDFLSDKHYEPIAVSFSLGIIADSLESLQKNTKKVMEPFGWKKCDIIQNNYSAIQEWFALFPGIYQRGYYEIFTSSFHAAHLTNFVAPLNTNSRDYMMFFEDKRGNLVNYNLLTENNTLFGGIVFAPPGKGKSAFLNYVLLIYYMRFLQKGMLNSFILDFGGSYKSIVGLMNSYIKNDNDKIVYKELNIEKNVYYNPFDVDFGKEITEDMIIKKVGLVLNFFKAALKDNVSETEEAILNIAIKRTLEKFLLSRNKQDLKIIEREDYSTEELVEIPCLLKYKESNYTDMKNFLAAMPNIADMIKVINTDPNIKQTFDFETKKELQDKLTYFVSTEIGNIFSQNSTRLITARNVVLDMKPIIQSDMSGFNLLLFYLYFVQSSWIRFTDHEIKNQKKLYLIDEYNQFASKSSVINDFSKMVYKTGRKENVDLYLASQNITDFPPDFFNSIGHAIMFESNNEQERREIKEIMGLSEEEKGILTKITTIPGKFSEIFIMTNSNSGKSKNILKFKITPYEYWAFITTTPIETYMKNELVKENEIVDVIDFLATKYPFGLTRLVIENQKDFLATLRIDIKEFLNNRFENKRN